jgi:hypothetical protein
VAATNEQAKEMCKIIKDTFEKKSVGAFSVVVFIDDCCEKSKLSVVLGGFTL